MTTLRRSVLSVARIALGLALLATALGSVARGDDTFPAVPEVDPGSAAAALTLLIGGGLLLKDRLLGARLRK